MYYQEQRLNHEQNSLQLSWTPMLMSIDFGQLHDINNFVWFSFPLHDSELVTRGTGYKHWTIISSASTPCLAKFSNSSTNIGDLHCHAANQAIKLHQQDQRAFHRKRSSLAYFFPERKECFLHNYNPPMGNSFDVAPCFYFSCIILVIFWSEIEILDTKFWIISCQFSCKT